ncbi:MBL fold metallo-hydrolase [Alloalcanivorax venustensis]|uniref:MBL fold metallo-hydrolase n=1 Tax=Alloalcanivorax venustensis TaxID=172371 RepID=UPI0039C21324
MNDSNKSVIKHHGAATGVTGSCHELTLDDNAGLLIDCGLFQGGDRGADGADAGRPEIEFDIGHISALVVTHVHLDHVGRIPWLLAAGFDGPIYCSEPSAELLPIMLEDAFKLAVSRQPEAINWYLSRVQRLLRPLPFDQWHSVYQGAGKEAAIRLRRAGHLLGSAYVECALTGEARGQDTRVIFSGDLGNRASPILRPPDQPDGCDILVLESTYGDREHDDPGARRHRLRALIERALVDRGTVLIPAFSIGRTQELLYELEDLIHENQGKEAVGGLHWNDLPVILDSPLAGRFTKAYRGLRAHWDEQALERVRQGRGPLAFEQLFTVDDHETHQRMVAHLAGTGRPAVVIAASGMCTGGRIVNYLKAMLGDPRHNVLFVGYQAAGTPGRELQTQGQGGQVELDGEVHEIKAGVDTIGGYSAHADRNGLLDFVTGMTRWPREIRLVHGDDQAKRALATELGRRYQGSAQKGRIRTSPGPSSGNRRQTLRR